MSPGLTVLLLAVLLVVAGNVFARLSARRVDRLIREQKQREIDAKVEAAKVRLRAGSAAPSDIGVQIGVATARITGQVEERHRRAVAAKAEEMAVH